MFRKNVLDDQTDTALSAIVDNLTPLKNIDSSLADSIGRALGAHMDGQLDKVISVVETACYEMAKYQAEAIKTTTNTFTQALQSSLGTHFDDLGQSIDRASQEYGAFAGQLAEITSTLREMGAYVSMIEDWSGKQMDSLKEFSTEYARTMASFGQCLSDLQGQTRVIQREAEETFVRLDGMLQAGSETVMAQKECLNEIFMTVNNIQGVMKAVDTAVKQVSTDSAEVAESTSQMLSAVSETIRTDSDAFTAVYEKTLASSSEKLLDMQKTYSRQLVDTADTIADHLKETVDTFTGQLKETADTYTGQLKDTSGTFAEQLKDTTNRFTGQIKDTTDTFARGLNEQVESYLKSSGEQMNLQTEMVKEEIERLRSANKRRGLFGRR